MNLAGRGGSDRDGLIRAYDEEASLGLGDLADETTDEDDDVDDPRSPMIAAFPKSGNNGNGNGGRTGGTHLTPKGYGNGKNGNGSAPGGGSESIELQSRGGGIRKSGER